MQIYSDFYSTTLALMCNLNNQVGLSTTESPPLSVVSASVYILFIILFLSVVFLCQTDPTEALLDAAVPFTLKPTGSQTV